MVFWVYSGLLYANVIYFPWPLPRWFGGTDWMLNSGLPLGLARNAVADAGAVLIFVTYPAWFYLGTEFALAGHRLTRSGRERERGRVVGAIVDTIFPKGGAIPPGASDVGTAGMIESLFKKIPAEFADGLTLLMLVFDSRFLVFYLTRKWRRFVDLGGPGPSPEKMAYLKAWESDANLSSATAALRVAASYGYYTRERVYKDIGYAGPSVPNVPPWYRPGPNEGAQTVRGGPAA